MDSDARSIMTQFVLNKMNSDGGFRGRSQASDLYYTVFAVDSLNALTPQWPQNRTEAFVRSFGNGENLDYVHTASLAKCRAEFAETLAETQTNNQILNRLRLTPDEFISDTGRRAASIYNIFLARLALDAYKTVHAPTQGAIDYIMQCRTPDGGFGNTPGNQSGTTTVTAATVALLADAGADAPPEAIEWIKHRLNSTGGFSPNPATPSPDLLSTATALFAMKFLDIEVIFPLEAFLEYIASLWTDEGGFKGHTADSEADCEFTFYGLLSLGTLV